MKNSKHFVFLLFTLFIAKTSLAQKWPGLTGTRDTSFTNYSALQHALRQDPKTKLAKGKKKNFLIAADKSYCQMGSRELKLDVFSNQKGQSKPCIVFVHGGGWRTGDKSQHHPLANALAQKGYVVFTPEYRLSTEALYPAAVQDLIQSIKWVKSHAADYNLDSNRIAIAGFSAGGQLAALLGTASDFPKFNASVCANADISAATQAIIDIDGILAFIHPESGEGDDSKSVSAATNYFGKTKEEAPELWQEASALNHIDAQDPPILFINSGVDRMHAGRTDFIHAYNALHIQSEIVEFPGTPHTFLLFDKWFNETVKAIDKFLDKVWAK
ncbi:alpha/beta hydrolase [Marinilongibacter aquaticus]|uniref:alpha/beta hydrolase n=1 Tax=Marinilongibacter aquaticus TaxID=2975157 RepID=UPI0021BD122A|nr:alpha/beta hydrolase [Marinilongibacter aquaticus]UBM58522.1 alpha/beta hydrolase [Marinilongibacter aquaticus]